MSDTITIKNWLRNFFHRGEHPVVAIWGGEDRCMVEIKGLGAFEITATKIQGELPPDVTVQRALDQGDKSCVSS
jgi:hypothetical protein